MHAHISTHMHVRMHICMQKHTRMHTHTAARPGTSRDEGHYHGLELGTEGDVVDKERSCRGDGQTQGQHRKSTPEERHHSLQQQHLKGQDLR